MLLLQLTNCQKVLHLYQTMLTYLAPSFREFRMGIHKLNAKGAQDMSSLFGIDILYRFK